MRILSDDEEVKHIVCFLKMTLNIHDEDENYVKLLNYKGNPETLIRIDTIKRIFGNDIFIPNVMGTLVKNHKGEIVSPTMLWLKWNKIPEFIENGFLGNEFENGINNTVPEDKADALFFNEKSYYPTADQLKDETWLTDNAPKLAILGDDGFNNEIGGDNYKYDVLPEGCDNGDIKCDGYKITINPSSNEEIIEQLGGSYQNYEDSNSEVDNSELLDGATDNPY